MDHGRIGGQIRRRRLMAAAATGALAMLWSPTLAGNATYAYDELGRLKTATYSDGTIVNYKYDPTGNRTQLIVNGTVANQPPTAVNDSISTPESVAKTFDPRTNDSDAEGDPLTITAKTDGAKGVVAINSGASRSIHSHQRLGAIETIYRPRMFASGTKGGFQPPKLIATLR